MSEWQPISTAPKDARLMELVRRSVEAVKALPPVDRAIHDVRQKMSLVRGMLPDESEWSETHQRVLDADPAAILMNEVLRLREALGRIAELTPERANARTARDLHLTVAAIAEAALNHEKDVSA